MSLGRSIAIENKVSKNLGLLCRFRRVLDSTAIKNLYFSFIHSYLNYGNIVWASTSIAKLKNVASKQKQALRFVNNEFIGINNEINNEIKLWIYINLIPIKF